MVDPRIEGECVHLVSGAASVLLYWPGSAVIETGGELVLRKNGQQFESGSEFEAASAAVSLDGLSDEVLPGIVPYAERCAEDGERAAVVVYP